jgi:hypothetical protein
MIQSDIRTGLAASREHGGLDIIGLWSLGRRLTITSSRTELFMAYRPYDALESVASLRPSTSLLSVTTGYARTGRRTSRSVLSRTGAAFIPDTDALVEHSRLPQSARQSETCTRRVAADDQRRTHDYAERRISAYGEGPRRVANEPHGHRCK